MIFEDAHWADPTSLGAFGRAVDRIATHCVLLLLIMHVIALIINRLTRREVEAMIDRVIGNTQLVANVKQDIAARVSLISIKDLGAPSILPGRGFYV
jgi:hypothetical protein